MRLWRILDTDIKMDIKKDFNKNNGKWFVNDVLKAIRKYSLIEKGEEVCVALSGGKDSITLLFILYYINRYSYLKFDLSAIHVKMAEYETNLLQELCNTLEVKYFEELLNIKNKSLDDNICYLCARLKRGVISKFLENKKIRKIAYGHHANDVAETFFMNIIQYKKLGSFSPKVEFTDNSMIMIRPMIYLEEDTIRSIHKNSGLPVLDFNCPYIKKNIRENFKKSVNELDSLFNTRNFARKLVDSLENIDFTNIWSELCKK